MQLISILLVIVGLLTLLSGIIVFFGSNKSDRPSSAWFLLAAIFATIWMAAVACFLTSKPDRAPLAPFLINTSLISALMLDVGFLGYGAWGRKLGRIITLAFLTAAVFISVLIITNPSLFYSDITLASTGNSARLIISPFYFLYLGFFAFIIPAILYIFFRQYRRARAKKKRTGGLAVLISFGISNLTMLVTNFIMPMPFINNWSMTWLGPLMFATVFLSVYYVILRYRAIDFSYTWLRIFSYVVVVASIAIVYMIIFSIVFAALFRGSTPSIEVIVLNFIMLLIFIALIPVVSGFVRFIHNLILEQHPAHAAKTDEKRSPQKS